MTRRSSPNPTNSIPSLFHKNSTIRKLPPCPEALVHLLQPDSRGLVLGAVHSDHGVIKIWWTVPDWPESWWATSSCSSTSTDDVASFSIRRFRTPDGQHILHRNAVSLSPFEAQGAFYDELPGGKGGGQCRRRSRRRRQRRLGVGLHVVEAERPDEEPPHVVLHCWQVVVRWVWDWQPHFPWCQDVVPHRQRPSPSFFFFFSLIGLDWIRLLDWISQSAVRLSQSACAKKEWTPSSSFVNA